MSSSYTYIMQACYEFSFWVVKELGLLKVVHVVSLTVSPNDNHKEYS